MLKSIKKSYNIFIVILAALVLSVTLLSLIVRIPAVQTFIVKKVTGYISGETKSTVSIGKVRFSFFNKLEFAEVLIKDQHNDTLLYAPEVVIGIRQLNRKNNSIRLGKVVVIKPVVGFITDSTGLMNLTWYLNLIQKPKASTPVKSSFLHINQVEISDGRFSLINKSVPPSKTPMDLNNIRLSGINVIIENLNARNDSTSFDIYNLGFKELSGFAVKRMSSNFFMYRQNIFLRDLNLRCDSSIISADHIGILADSTASFKRFTEEVKFDISLRKSLINSNDLKYFLPFSKDINESVWLSGDVTGTISELKGRNLKLTFKNKTYLDCNCDFSGLPDIKNTFIFIDVKDLRSISKDIEQINLPGKGFILLPEVLRKLGVVSFSGRFTGFTTDFVTYGKINTNRGIISTDVSLRPSGSGSYNIKGLIRGTDIDLGSITDNPVLFGRLGMEANIDGTAASFKKFEVNLTGKIDSVEINNYKYRNIQLKGLFTDKAWDGSIKVEDENIHMDILGMFDFSRKLPEFDFTLNLLKANLYKLNIDKTDTSSSATLLLTADFNGNSIDNLEGEIKLLNSNFRKYGNNLGINDFTIKAFTLNNIPSISLRTDFLDANLYGRYNFAEIGNAVKSRLAALMPSRFEKPKTRGKFNANNFIFDIRFKNTDELNKFLRTGIVLSGNSFVQGSFFPDSIISVSAKTKQFSINNNIFNNLSIEGSSTDTVSKVSIRSSSFNLSGISDFNDLALTFNSVPDHFRFLADWDNKEKIIDKGTFIVEGAFEKKSAGQKNAMLKIGFQPAEVYVRNNLWKINPSVILIDSNSVKVQKLSILNNENYFFIDGTLSVNPSDTVHLEFKGININPLNILYEKKLKNDPNAIRLALGGTLNGRISLTNVYRNFMFESDINVRDFAILGSHFGEVKIGSVWNSLRKVADVTVNNDFEGRKMFDITGFFDPGTGKADLTAKADKLPIDLLNPLLKIFASGITGTASGTVKFFGNFNEPVLTGALMAENATIKIDYLQTKYRFNDTIRFDRTGIKFNNIRALDDKGNIATVNGTVSHKYFKNFAADLTISIPKTNEFMVLNTRPKDNDLFYGTAYASGVTTIKSNDTGLSFAISAKTGKNTRFFIPLSTGSSVSDVTFINFVDSAKAKKQTGSPGKVLSANPTQSGFEINCDLEVTPDAEVQIIFDSKAGDVMKGTGTGNLNISLDKNGQFKIYGDYIIEDGDYLFTLRNIFNKRFIVQNGGKISFNGAMSDAEIDIKAIYKLKASLNDIMPGMLPDTKLKEKIPVECILNLTGNLFNPVVGLEINLPTADEETRAYLRSMIKSDEEMSRQFAFLLVMNSFYADPSAGTSQSTADIGSATVGVTTTEMLSNQISNWLSKISNNFDIGVVWRPGTAATPNSQDVQVALSTQLLNDKVIINGNFDVEGTQTTPGTSQGNNAITGAFDVEFKITEKIRFKVFNRSNDYFYIDNGIQYTQGVGLFYRQDFNKIKDLFKKQEKSDMKKEEATKIKNK
jgi:TamB, inner membrane protein subunit of TAM complex